MRKLHGALQGGVMRYAEIIIAVLAALCLLATLYGGWLVLGVLRERAW